MKTAEVVIVGGGVIGLAIARELALRSVQEVTLVERSQPGAEASSAAGGILAPQIEAEQSDEFFRLACASRDMYPEFAVALHQETGIDVELDTTGTLYVGFDDQDEEQFRGRYAWQKNHGLSIEWLSGQETRSLEPNIAKGVIRALRFPDDWQVENRRLIQALVSSNANLGVRLVPNCRVNTVTIQQQSVRGVETSSGFIGAHNVIIAAGAWSSFIQRDSQSINIRPVRGQMLCFTPSSNTARHVIYGSRGYLVPRRDGRLLAGSTSEHVGFEKHVTDEGVKVIRSMAQQIVPMLRDVPLTDSWAGFRPCADDGLPVLGPSEDIRGLFWATGHYRNGILLAPISAKLLAETIVDGVAPPSLSKFSPKRFGTFAAAA